MTAMFSGMREVATRYQGIILDLWGVVHDGAAAYARSAETFAHLKAAGCQVILLSNAPRRGYALVAQMERFGIPRSLYDDVMSSGEAVNGALRRANEAGFINLGPRAYHLGPERDASVFDEVAVERVALAQADFIVNTGIDRDDETLALYEPILAQAIARHLPMICANPDRWIVRAGRRIMCAGVIAARYEALGGTVTWRGKPDPAIYALCLERLGLPAHQVAVVGDALETDMQGAANAGLDGIWVTGGLHAGEVDGGYGIVADPAKVTAVSHAQGLNPVATVPSFIWP